MNSEEISKYKKLLFRYIDHTTGSEDINELCEIFINEIWDLGSDEVINELLPILKYYIRNNINNLDEIDLFGTTANLELFIYTISLSENIDVIDLMRQSEDGAEHLMDIIELIYNNKLKLPKKVIEKHFTDENLKWCGWYEKSDELRKLYK